MKKILFLVFSVFLLTLGGWIALLGNINPYQTGLWAHLTFFILLFLWFWGGLTLLNYFLRVRLNNLELIYLPFKIAGRQSLLLTLAVVGLLVFWFFDVLNWLSAGIFVLLVLSIEFYFQSRSFSVSS